MNKITKLILLLFTLVLSSSFLAQPADDKIKILLIGDSTTAGGRKILKESIEKLLMAEEGTPEVEVINCGKGGDTAYELIHSGRYEKEIKNLEDIDYIFFRYGLNDYIPGKEHRKERPFEDFFKLEIAEAVSIIKKDFPEAHFTLMNIIPWRTEEIDNLTNNIINEVAKEEDVAFMDIYTPYKNAEQKLGENTLRVRFFPLKEIPKRYHEILKPFTKYIAWKDEYMVRVETKEFDAVFNNLPNWYKDRHPNNAGYRIIAEETVDYLLPFIKK